MKTGECLQKTPLWALRVKRRSDKTSFLLIVSRIKPCGLSSISISIKHLISTNAAVSLQQPWKGPKRFKSAPERLRGIQRGRQRCFRDPVPTITKKIYLKYKLSLSGRRKPRAERGRGRRPSGLVPFPPSPVLAPLPSFLSPFVILFIQYVLFFDHLAFD